MSKKKKKIGSTVFMVLMVLFLYAPIIYTMVFSFNEGKSLTNFTGFSLKWYSKMFANKTMMESLFYTIACAVLATAISTVTIVKRLQGISQPLQITIILTPCIKRV